MSYARGISETPSEGSDLVMMESNDEHDELLSDSLRTAPKPAAGTLQKYQFINEFAPDDLEDPIINSPRPTQAAKMPQRRGRKRKTKALSPVSEDEGSNGCQAQVLNGKSKGVKAKKVKTSRGTQNKKLAVFESDDENQPQSFPEARPSPGQARPGQAHRQAFQGLGPGLIFDKAQASVLGPGLSSVEGPAANPKRQAVFRQTNVRLTRVLWRTGPMKFLNFEGKHLRHAVANTRADTSFDVLTDTQSTAPVEMHSGTLDSEGLECIDDTCTTVSDTSNATRGHAQSDAVDGNGLLEDIDVQDISPITKARREDKTMDISAFFGAPYAAKSKDGKTRNVRDCKSCHKKGFPHQITLGRIS
ncbi:uncharacterized protein F5891DRAFT_986138 [Suillus fuscotomentosus]|uniref:Uncharacterized protein n=1 Tax=Suillus fuscotomentosus TaxID=1912939 RepID=A0AAD4HF37_9AGAM|nr:uncharacterized protein F5891DRAFT_986138 [Suillus fuscotomentosus]KAG1893144.1 hypothetical protein F5891DRAFT_986138 [Suillus fuscotomentosus]